MALRLRTLLPTALVLTASVSCASDDDGADTAASDEAAGAGQTDDGAEPDSDGTDESETDDDTEETEETEGTAQTEETDGDPTDADETDADEADETSDAGAAVGPGEDAGAELAATDSGGPSPEPPENYLEQFGSGTRLSAIYDSVQGVPDRFAGFYDTELDGSCYFMNVEGQLLCVPQMDFSFAEQGFADAECTTRVFSVPECAPALTFLVEPNSPCRTQFSVTELTQPASPVAVYRQDPGGACVAQETEALPPERARIASAETDLSRFVAGTERVLPSTGQLSVAVVDAEDGAFAPAKLIDLELQTQCVAQHALEGVPCTPARRAFYEDNIYADDACAEPLAVAYASTPAECGEVDYVVAPFAEDGEPSLYYPAEEYDNVAWTTVGECTPRAEAPWLEHLLVLGDPAPEPATLNGDLLGDGRLQGMLISDGDTPLMLVAPTYWDPQTEQTCSPTLVDGEHRCITQNLWDWSLATNQFADDTCSEPLIYCNTDSCETSLWVEEAPSDGCSGERPLSTLRRVVSPVTDPVYELEGDTCLGPVEPFQAWTWELAAPTEFGLIERVVPR